MSIPVNLLRWAGVWDASSRYSQYDFAESPIDGKCYVYVGLVDIVGGADPSVPNPLWTQLNAVVGTGITSLNGLTAPAMSIASTDGSVSITPVAPNQVDLSVVKPVPLAYGSFSSSATQTAPLGSPILLFYTDDDVPAVGCSSAITSPYITVVNAGVYKVLTSVQMNKTGGGNAEVDMYPEVDGVPVSNSATKLQINNTEESVMTVEWFLQMGAGSRVAIALYTPTTNDIQALAVPAVVGPPAIPAIPSIITTLLRIA